MRRLIISAMLVLLVAVLMVALVPLLQYGSSGGGARVTISQETTSIVEPLDERGVPDYVAALNKRYSEGITPENNAAVLLWKALGPAELARPLHRRRYFDLLEISPLPELGDYFAGWNDFVENRRKGQQLNRETFERMRDRLAEARTRPWSAGEFPDLAAWLEANEKPLQLVMRATHRPRFYAPLISNADMGDSYGAVGGTILYLVPQCREPARGLAARALQHVQEGHTEQAWRDIMACYRLSRIVGQSPTLIERLVAFDINNYACDAAAALAHDGDLSAEQIGRFRDDMDKLQDLPTLAEAVDVAERFGVLDRVIRVHMQGGPPLRDPDLLEFIQDAWRRRTIAESFNWDEVLRIVNKHFDQLVAALERPNFRHRKQFVEEFFGQLMKARRKHPAMPHGQFATVEGINAEVQWLLERIAESDEERQVRTRTAGHLLAAQLMPAVLQDVEEAAQARVRMDQLDLAFALAAYRTEHGTYPEELTDLVPQHLEELPEDRFSGKTFRFRKQDEGYLLYSVGPNGQDDGGDEGEDVVLRVPTVDP